MTIKDQALKRLTTGCEASWNANPLLKARAVEIIESLAKQLEAKGDLTEEYKRGYQDGAREATELREENKFNYLCKCCYFHESKKEDDLATCLFCDEFSNFKPKGE